MLTSHPLSTYGPEGMDFGRPGGIMSHAAAGCVIKPWRKPMLRRAVGGVPPTLTDKLHYKYAQAPIQLYSRSQFFWKKLALHCGAAIGRFISRSPGG